MTSEEERRRKLNGGENNERDDGIFFTLSFPERLLFILMLKYPFVFSLFLMGLWAKVTEKLETGNMEQIFCFQFQFFVLVILRFCLETY